MRVGLLFLTGMLGCSPSQNPYAFRPPQTSTTHATANETSGASLAPGSPDVRVDQTGLATWYGDAFAGRKTANGERFDPKTLTAAHRTLPFGTWVEVRRPDTGRSVRVRINDRGPFGDPKRIIDLSKKAASDLDLLREGVARVELKVVEGP